jgi:hypothetical protein
LVQTKANDAHAVEVNGNMLLLYARRRIGQLKYETIGMHRGDHRRFHRRIQRDLDANVFSCVRDFDALQAGDSRVLRSRKGHQ